MRIVLHRNSSKQNDMPMHLHLKAPQRLRLTGDVESNWLSFKQHFLLYLRAWGRDKSGEPWKVSKLLSVAGPQAQVVYNTFHFERPEDRITLDVVLEKFDFHCSQERNGAFWRYVFRSRTQQPGEPFESFLADLRLKAQTCNFGAGLTLKDSLVRDQIVFGVENQAVRATLLKCEGLTLDGALRICRAAGDRPAPPPPQPQAQTLQPPMLPGPTKSFRKQNLQDSANTTARGDIAMEAVGGVSAADIPQLTKGQRKRLRDREKKKVQKAAVTGYHQSWAASQLSSEPELCTKCLDYHHPDERCFSSPCSSEKNAKRRKTQESATRKAEGGADDDQGDDGMMVTARDSSPHPGDAWSQNYLDGNVAREDKHSEAWYLDTIPDNL